MLYYWDFGLCPSSDIPKNTKNTTFRKLDLLPSAGEGWETPTLLGPLERANLNHWTSEDKLNINLFLCLIN
jgi:hypothetical protein